MKNSTYSYYNMKIETYIVTK